MTKTTATDTRDLSVIGVDIGKDVFHLVGFDSDGKIAGNQIQHSVSTNLFEEHETNEEQFQQA